MPEPVIPKDANFSRIASTRAFERTERTVG
jgi:hypothetical protein